MYLAFFIVAILAVLLALGSGQVEIREQIKQDPLMGALMVSMIPLFALRFFFPQFWVRQLYAIPLILLMIRQKDWADLGAILLAWGGGNLALWLGLDWLAAALALTALLILLGIGIARRKQAKSK